MSDTTVTTEHNPAEAVSLLNGATTHTQQSHAHETNADATQEASALRQMEQLAPRPNTLAETARKILWVRENYSEAKRLTAQLQDRWFSEFHWPRHKLSYLDLLDRLVAGH